MSNIYFAADHHFGHSKVLTFTKSCGAALREFADVDSMNWSLVQAHNSVARASDTTYFLGDVTLSRNESDLAVLERMNGHKVLILGNHDIQPLERYLKYFKSVKAIHALADMVLTHVPLHPNSLQRWGTNVHGHLHSNVVTTYGGTPDPRYVCVSVEQLVNYVPITLNQLRSKIEVQKATLAGV